ncbi:DNA primase [Acidiphilium sp.]|uniref:DNA primase n=1 Tax=Acidiphilium sp. TaxID=527 RepID=UPI00258A633B|nr:DNA primase [Acidiphilium sp.]
MSLPPHFLDELRHRTPLAPLVARRVRLERAGRDQKGCCPFHNEKSPSFYVYDDHYHCFGCGAHGDAISFVMQSEGASFIEAVERLAAEAGLDVPKPSPAAAEAAKREAELADVLEAAAAEYRRRLALPEGETARAYLAARGLDAPTIARFGLGWSGEGRGSLRAALARQGIAESRLVEAGLMKQGERGAVDYFYGRVMFPIRDRAGRMVSFGGRLLGDGQPKYLNGPETALFSKRRTLYGIDAARPAIRAGAALIVVEGYMDVIALAAAGFEGAVAPLGTALTESHLEELWRLSPRPILCLDGDAAGRRAALRAIELALKQLTPDRGLAVLTLPGADDPDSFIRREGAAAFAARLAAVPSLADTLYLLLAESADQATPEGRAALRHRLEEVARTIEDKALAGEYRGALLDRFFAARRGRQAAGRAPGRAPDRASGRAPAGAPPRPLGLPRPSIDPSVARLRRARMLTGLLIAHPDLLPALEEAFGLLALPDDCARLRAAMSVWLATAEALDSALLLNHLAQSGLREAAELALSVLPRRGRGKETAGEALESLWYGIYGLMNLDWLRQQCEEQRIRFEQDPTPENNNRLRALVEARYRAERGEADLEAPT